MGLFSPPWTFRVPLRTGQFANESRHSGTDPVGQYIWRHRYVDRYEPKHAQATFPASIGKRTPESRAVQSVTDYDPEIIGQLLPLLIRQYRHSQGYLFRNHARVVVVQGVRGVDDDAHGRDIRGKCVVDL
jgi:hypothetical protein